MYNFIIGAAFTCLVSFAIFLWLASRAPVMYFDDRPGTGGRESKPKRRGDEDLPRVVNR